MPRELSCTCCGEATPHDLYTVYWFRGDAALIVRCAHCDTYHIRRRASGPGNKVVQLLDLDGDWVVLALYHDPARELPREAMWSAVPEVWDA